MAETRDDKSAAAAANDLATEFRLSADALRLQKQPRRGRKRGSKGEEKEEKRSRRFKGE